MDLPTLLATDVVIHLGGNDYQAKVLNLLETAEVFSSIEKIKAEKGDAYGNVMMSVMLLTKALMKHYPAVTNEYVSELVNNRDAEEITQAINLIGGFDPKGSEGVIGNEPSESSPPTPAGIPEPLEV